MWSTTLLTAVLSLGAEPRASADERDTLVLTTSSTTSTVSAESPGEPLTRLVERALARNLRIRIDEAQVGEAQALYRYAAAQAYPRFSATALFGGPTPERKTTVVNDLSTITQSSLEGDLRFGDLGFTFRASAEGALPLYTFGKISNAKEAASSVVRAARERVAITEAEVVVQVHNAFWAYQLTRSFITSLEEGEQMLGKVLAKIEELLDADSPQVTENDRLRLLYALATVRVRLTEARQASDLARAAMKLLVGDAQTAPLEIAGADLDVLPPVPPLGDQAREAMTWRPELRALRALVDAQQKFAAYRESSFWPDIFIGGILRYAYTSNSTDQTNPFIYDDANLADVGVGLGMRVELDVFSKLAELEQAETAIRTRSAQAAAAEQAVDLEVRKLHSDLVNGYERIRGLERANRAARGWLTASTLAYDIGTGDASELIESFLAWAASEGELQKTRYDMQLGHADFARAIGRLVRPKTDDAAP
ncbi:TolC family protein [Myxococcota bacterium]|nr:TolC family protein [Myxococcota bacterium]